MYLFRYVEGISVLFSSWCGTSPFGLLKVMRCVELAARVPCKLPELVARLLCKRRHSQNYMGHCENRAPSLHALLNGDQPRGKGMALWLRTGSPLLDALNLLPAGASISALSVRTCPGYESQWAVLLGTSIWPPDTPEVSKCRSCLPPGLPCTHCRPNYSHQMGVSVWLLPVLGLLYSRSKAIHSWGSPFGAGHFLAWFLDLCPPPSKQLDAPPEI